MTFVKVCPKIECNIYSDIDMRSAISINATGNSRSFTVLTDRLAFVNFSSPDPKYIDPSYKMDLDIWDYLEGIN